MSSSCLGTGFFLLYNQNISVKWNLWWKQGYLVYLLRSVKHPVVISEWKSEVQWTGPGTGSRAVRSGVSSAQGIEMAVVMVTSNQVGGLSKSGNGAFSFVKVVFCCDVHNAALPSRHCRCASLYCSTLRLTIVSTLAGGEKHGLMFSMFMVHIAFTDIKNESNTGHHKLCWWWPIHLAHPNNVQA